MRPAKEDETELLKAARKRLGRDVTLQYAGYSSTQGHLWVVYRQGRWCARGWFDANGDPHFVELKDKR